METLDQILIERYLGNEMTAVERSDFEKRLAIEPELKQELEEFTLVMEALKVAERKELLNRFHRLDLELDKKKGNSPLNFTRNIWLIFAAAAVIAAFLGWRLLFTSENNATLETNVNPPDSVIVQQPILVKEDTVQEKELIKEVDQKNVTQKDKGPKDPSNQIMAVSASSDGEELYADNFEPYVDESMSVTSRADEDNLTPYEKFQLSYTDKNYNEAIEAFKKLSPSLQQNDNIRFFQANALMAVNHISEASVILNEILNNPKASYKTEALYYLALCDVKNGKFESARNKLLKYTEQPGAEQKQKAASILAGLK